MAVSRTRFGHTALLVRSGLIQPVSGTWIWFGVGKTIVVVLEFPEVMDTHLPDIGKFTFNVDGAPHTSLQPTFWRDDTHLALTCVTGGSRPSVITIDYDGTDPLFMSAISDTVRQLTDFPLTVL